VSKYGIISNDRRFMFNQILVPVDGSDHSWNALEQAIEVAKEEGSTIHGLFVTDARESQ
jgi:nucleotide-binding universal stress UspA family protein